MIEFNNLKKEKVVINKEYDDDNVKVQLFA